MSNKTQEKTDMGPDMGADAGPEPSDIGPDTGRVYYCKYCGMSFGDGLAMGRHIRRDHRQDKQPTGNNGDEGGAPSETDPRDLEAKDLQKQVKILELRRQELEKELRIRRLDPYGGRGPAPEDPDLQFLSSLKKRELIDSEIERIKAQTESIRTPQLPQVLGEQYEEVTEYVDKDGNLAPPDRAFTMRTTKRPVASAPRESADVRELKEKVENLRESLENQKFDSLKNTFDAGLTSLRSEIRANSSELRVLIESATDLAKTWISSPGPATQIIASKMGFKAVVEDLPSPAAEEQRVDIVEALKPFGFTGRIVEKKVPT